MKFSLNSNGKINIGLNVTGRCENGYHLLDMVMVPISLSDTMTGEITDAKGTLTIETNKKDIPTGKENILYKIYDKFYDESALERKKVYVYLEKRIPHQAGLGGGSSNGAFLLKLLNSFHDNHFSMEKMIEIGKSVGADIPFFLINKSARVTGIGENIEIIENNLDSALIIIKPDFGVSTGKAYKNMYMLNNKRDADIDKIVLGLKENSLSTVENSIENHLEQGLLLEDENIIDFRKRLAALNNMKFFMSGSGSAYYTFADKNEKENIYKILKEHFKNCEVHLCGSL
ncbi:4-(cytidine 5'-diphospho)-2-C-methyl-D-erythritol kinase [Fusobacterium ulcerans]|uniref:4-diphosphocytidyl-2-C-methyl-D-erythritol kinase n=1 Tax=Fusobacterium ulcerans TaxID=861 RepID=A0AAX1TQZ0_9FUSO|nr:4-(cytidine 5'-diphospho)-2-C-methyl-D-erythritol kinase [Fusobacterium ulcerans]AVQ27701.1 4-(cytidine 5'-diphospho)-2-C-methyl-D-erythritol kinase [Fusobacterium ulcerans]EFS27125.1 4-(cytidine 5'-diphospho)-2-C-methyl-D-erythritol kinase [Fusobacterium ulcerans ATCC 49185]RGY64370.1 4-(cytidine 5'-diphospho)-2-C-methyl-D-erythritol kinase [Fusobacterium ulcerans]SQJ15848.1 4-diphosphocytidyl-2-C-methyl-D-erythritol kinase [Fusobacterium ulcerans]